MNQDHRLQQQRFELKYLIDEAMTPAIRDFVSSYLELDDYAVGKPNFCYPVHSLYLDSADLRTCQASTNGTKNRFKLRLRYYDDKPASPVFFEIKARVDNCILKQRCGVRRDAVPLMLAGQIPDPDQVLSKEARHWATLERFNLMMHQLRARPKVHNSYLREAWVSTHDNSIRVTMDRKVRMETCFLPVANVRMSEPVPVFQEFVILELKFTDRFPNWFRVLASRFNLIRSACSKYCEGIWMLGEHRFHDGERACEWRANGEETVRENYASAA